MATATRTDVHRPSVIDPADYEFVAVEVDKVDDDIGKLFALADERKRIASHMAATGGTYSDHRHGGNCHVCGAHCIYTALFYHRPSNAYIRCGFDCTDKLVDGIDNGMADRFRAVKAAVKGAREAKAGRQKAALILADHGLQAAWELYQADRDNDYATLVKAGAMQERKGAHPDGGSVFHHVADWRTVSEIVDKLVRYGDISDKQVTFVRTLLDRMRRADEIQAAKEAERAAAADAPSGRHTVEVEVLKVALHEGAYGTTTKMTCKHASGWICWGTVPAGLDCEDTSEEHERYLRDAFEPLEARRNAATTDAERAALDRELDQVWKDAPAWQRVLQRGDRIKLTATFEPSDRDPKFALFKRPKGERLKA